MRGGFILARCEWPDLRRAFEDIGGPLTDEGPFSQAEWLRHPAGDDILYAASKGGCCYVLDPLFALSSDSDLIVELSRRLSCHVVGAGAETLSGTFWFTAASGGKLRRVYHDQKVSLTEPSSLGAPLGSERITPFDNPDGVGLLGGAHAGGFDVDLLLHGPAEGGKRVRWPVEQYPAQGELGQRHSEHYGSHQRPDADGWEKNIKVIARGNGQYDLRAWSSEPGCASWPRKLFRRR